MRSPNARLPGKPRRPQWEHYTIGQDDLKLKNYAPGTVGQYLSCARRFVEHFGISPVSLDDEAVRKYVLAMTGDKSLTTIKMHVAAIRFLYEVTLRSPEVVVGLHFPKVPHRLPDILSLDEVRRLLEAVEPPLYRAVLMTAYGAGMRISEACSLLTTDIDSGRGVIHVRQGKRNRDRYVMLSAVLLATLREYWKLYRPAVPILFPGERPQSCVSHAAVRLAMREAKARAGITKRVTPHSLRHAFATHLLAIGPSRAPTVDRVLPAPIHRLLADPPVHLEVMRSSISNHPCSCSASALALN